MFFDSFNAIYQSNSLNVSLVEDLLNLERIDFYSYSDGKQNYRFNYDKYKLIPIQDKLSENALFYKAISSYSNCTASFYNDNGTLKYANDKGDIHIKRKINTKVKFLELAYAYDDYIYIEGQEIISIADFDTLEFLGSTVDVIQPCDGGKGQIPVVINYYYFFKDKVYSYYSGGKKIKIIENKAPENFMANNYNQLKSLQI